MANLSTLWTNLIAGHLPIFKMVGKMPARGCGYLVACCFGRLRLSADAGCRLRQVPPEPGLARLGCGMGIVKIRRRLEYFAITALRYFRDML